MKENVRKFASSIDVCLFSLGTLISYIPLYMLTRMASEGLLPSARGISFTGFEILPLYSVGTALASLAFLRLSGWLTASAHSKVLGFSIPRPRWYIVLSGLCTITQIITATWAYTFTGISIALVALLMKGGVLIIAPVVDGLVKTRRRKIYWPSWVASALSLFALSISFLEKADVSITLACAADIIIYLLVYSLKLSIMSRFAKTVNTAERRQFIAEEQLVIAAGFILALGVMALGSFVFNGFAPFKEIMDGFTALPVKGPVIELILVGAVATTTGIFSSLVFLDRRENTFCVAAVQSSSIVAGAVATVFLSMLTHRQYLSANKLISVCIIVFAIAFLAFRGAVERRKNVQNC